MKLPLRIGLAAGLLAAASACFAWIDTGHMLVADIARMNLKPAVRDKIDALLKIGGDAKTQDMLGAACWADDVRRERRDTGPWHYIDQYFRLDGKPVINKPDVENVVWALNKFEPILKDKTRSAAERAEALRWILHFVGDIHQPLHCVSLETDAMPKGDKGGNDFHILPPTSMADMTRPITNLHTLWDFACGMYRGTERPLTPQTKSSLDVLASALMKKFPEKSLRETRILDPKKWAAEGLAVAKSDVYNLPMNTAPTEAYISKGIEICGRRITLAGYRLARLLNSLLS